MNPERIAEIRHYAEGIARNAGGAKVRAVFLELLIEVERLQEEKRLREQALENLWRSEE